MEYRKIRKSEEKSKPCKRTYLYIQIRGSYNYYIEICLGVSNCQRKKKNPVGKKALPKENAQK